MDVLSSAQLQSKELLQYAAPAKAQSVTWIGFLTEAAMISVSYAINVKDRQRYLSD